MSLKHSALALAYHPLRLGNSALRLFGKRPAGRLRVLIFHDIPLREEARFAAHLRWLNQSWKFIDKARFEAMISGEEAVREDSLLLTFDDGFASNRRIAEKVLNPMGIRGLFFVVSSFAALTEKDDWRGFVARNIYPRMRPEDVPEYSRNMTWDDLAYLLETGHAIGGHTASHARLSQLGPENLQTEIVESADILEMRLGVTIDHFAYTFGDLDSFSKEALGIARSRFRFIHTSLRGENAQGVPPWAIRRDAIQPADSYSLVGALLEGGADRLYRDSISTYESWGNRSCA